MVLCAGVALAVDKPAAAFERVEYRVDNLPRVMGHLVIEGDGRVRLRAHRDGDEQDVPLPLGKDELIDEDLAKLGEIVGSIDWKKIKPRYAVEGRKPPKGAGCHTIIATVAGKRYETYVERLDKEGGPPETLNGLVWFLAVYEGMILPDPLPMGPPPAEFRTLTLTTAGLSMQIDSEGAVLLNGAKLKPLSKQQVQALKGLAGNVDWDGLAASSPAKADSARKIVITAGRREYQVEVQGGKGSRALGALFDELERLASPKP